MASPSVEGREQSKCTGLLGKPRRSVGLDRWFRLIEGWFVLNSVGYAPRNLVGSRLRALRLGLGLSQAAFADTVRAVGLDIGEPNRCSKRLVQKWEAGDHGTPSKPYRRAIERLTGEVFSNLCAPAPPKDATDAARRVSRVIAAVTELEAELFDLHAFLNRRADSEMEHGPRQ